MRGDPCTGRVDGDAAQVDPAEPGLGRAQQVEAGQPQGADRKEVAGEDPGGPLARGTVVTTSPCRRGAGSSPLRPQDASGPTTPTLRSRGRRARLGSAGSPTAGSLSMPIRTVRSAAGVRRCRGARSGSPGPSMLTSCPVTDAGLSAAPPAYALSTACPGVQGCGQWGLASTPGLQEWVDAPPSRVRPAPAPTGFREVISGKAKSR